MAQPNSLLERLGGVLGRRQYGVSPTQMHLNCALGGTAVGCCLTPLPSELWNSKEAHRAAAYGAVPSSVAEARG